MIVFYDLKYDETREKMIKVSLVKGCETFEIQLESEDITAENVIRKFCDQNDCDFEKAKKTLSVFACFCKDNKNNPIEWCFPLTLTNNLKTTKDYCGRELELSKDCVFKIKRNPLLRISFEKKVSDPVILKLLYQEAKENIERNLYFFSKKQEKKLKKLDKTFVRKTSVESAESSDSTEEDKQSLVGNEANFLSICRELKQYGGFAFNGRIDGSIIASLLHSSKFFGKKREPEKNVAVVINEHGLHVVNLKCPVCIGRINKFLMFFCHFLENRIFFRL